MMADEAALGPARLKGRTAVVTGASRGLGRAIALAMAAEGARVAVVARSEAVWDERLPGTVHDAVAEIEAAGGTAVAIPADLTNEEDLERVVDVTERELGSVDILVNNAALTVGGRPPAPGSAPRVRASTMVQSEAPSFVSFPLKAYRLHLAVNVLAAFRLMQLVLPGMVARGSGSIVNISSNAAFTPGEGPYASVTGPALFAYGSTKAALHNISQAVAYEMSPKGIAVNVLLPSLPIHTPGSDSLLPEGTISAWGDIGEFAEAAVRLAMTTPDMRTGQLLFHDDVLHPELGRRNWLSTET